jgi:hypothetical protein
MFEAIYKYTVIIHPFRVFSNFIKNLKRDNICFNDMWTKNAVQFISVSKQVTRY